MCNPLVPLVSLSDYVTMAAQEVVNLVDEKNNIIGPAKRKDVRTKNLLHQATYIFVHDSQ